MKKTCKNKTMGFLGVFLMSIMLVIASGAYSNPFVSDNKANVAIVYGANAAATDVTAADSIVNNLASGINALEDITDRIISDGVTEDEVVLGGDITISNKIKTKFTDNKIPSLFDGKIEWYDGSDTNSYNTHEEILINNLDILTTLDNNDFEDVALTNNKGLEYKYVFEENIFGENYSDLTVEDADFLEVTILGKEYLIEDATDNSIIVTDAKNGIFGIGDNIVTDGVTLTVNDIYDNAISVNGIFVKEGKKKTINGVQVKVENVYYKDSATLPSKVELYYGGEISKEYFDGDAYIGEDEDDPEWVWSIENPGREEGYIGVKYDLKQTDEKDDVVYEGEEYTFPNNFVTVSFDGLTDVDYSEYEIYFDEVDLYYAVGNSDCEQIGDDEFEVLVIEGIEDDSFELLDGTETDTLYFELDNDGNIVNLYYKDVAEDYSNNKAILYEDVGITLAELAVTAAEVVLANAEGILEEAIESGVTEDITLAELAVTAAEVVLANAEIAVLEAELAFYANLATLITDETEMDISVFAVDNNITISNDVSNITINLGEEDSAADDGTIIVDGISIRNEDNDVMDHYGTIIESPESNMDDDKVVLRVPSEQVYAQISVFGSEQDLLSGNVTQSTPAELGIAKVTDGQVPADKNVIVVGGSCINTMAADLLGGKFCGAEFTAKTGVVAGQVLIQTFDRGDGNIATLVAGYTAADTVRGVQYLLANDVNIAVGEKVII